MKYTIMGHSRVAISFFRERHLPMVGDYSLNITNGHSANFFHEEGLARVTASYDCNRDQLLTLVTSTQPERLEVVIHQHMPLFHMVNHNSFHHHGYH